MLAILAQALHIRLDLRRIFGFEGAAIKKVVEIAHGAEAFKAFMILLGLAQIAQIGT